MKTLLLKYKFAILSLIAFATDFLINLKQTAGIDDIWLEVIGTGLAILSIVKRRLENEYLAKQKNAKLQIKFSFVVGLVDLFVNWLQDFKPENMKKEENIPSHLAIGMGVANLVLSFINPPSILLDIFHVLFFCFLVGMLIEAIQVKYFEGKYSTRDIRWGIVGGYLWFGLDTIFKFNFDLTATMIISLNLFVASIIFHSSLTKLIK